MKFLINSQCKYVVSNMEEADQLEQKLRSNSNFTVTRFDKKQKIIKTRVKSGNQTIIETEEYVLCSVLMTFNDEKDPCDCIDLEFIFSDRHETLKIKETNENV